MDIKLMHADRISFCSIYKFKSIEELLVKELLFSRSEIKKLKLKKEFLKKEVREKDELSFPINLFNKGIVNPNFHGRTPEVLFQNEKLIVLNKPHSLHCHPLNYNESDNVLSFLRFQNLLGDYTQQDKNHEKGLLYRLDNVTSGVLFYIKDSSLGPSLRESFSTLAKEKKYLAVVSGEFNYSQSFQHKFSPSGKKGMKMKVSADGEGESGEVSVRKVAYNKEDDVSLVEVILKHGLRHQIRAQLSFLNHPIVGDGLYGGRDSERVFLHAYSYSVLIDGEVVEVKASKAELFDRFFNLDSVL